MKFGVGQPVRRFEDLSLITGRGRYTDDITLPNMAHAFVLRSPVAHGEIRRHRREAARGMPGVLLILTGHDVAADGLGDIPCGVPLINRDGTPRHDTPRPVLATGKVRHVGQPVAFVVAETLGAGARRRGGDRGRLRDPAGRGRRPRGAGARRAAVVRPYPGQPGVRLGQRHVRFRRDRSGVRPRRPRDEARPRQQPRGRQLDGAAQRDRRLGRRRPGARCFTPATQGSHFVRDPLAEAVLKVPKEKLRVVTPPTSAAASA